MIEYKNNKKETCLNVMGSTLDILSDISYMICLIHGRMMEQDPDMAEAFKKEFKEAVNNDVCFVDEDGECGAKKMMERLKREHKGVGVDLSNLDSDMADEFLNIIKKALGKKGGSDQ